MALPTASDNPFTSLLIVEGTEPSAPAAGRQRLYIDSTTHKLKRTDSSGTDVTIEGTSGYLGYIMLQDQQTANTAGGTFTSGAWRTRVLNTEVTDTNSDCSLASNQITLTAGTYECRLTAPAYNCDRHKTRLQNVTDSTTVLLGTSDYAPSGVGAETRSVVSGRFTIAASKALEFQHQCQTTSSSLGLGVATNFAATEVYATAEFWRVS